MVVAAGLAPSPSQRDDLLSNRLVLATAAPAPPHIDPAVSAQLANVLGDGRLAIADPQSVPLGIYGRAALTALGLWPVVAGRLAPARNARQALAFVEQEAAPVGLLYLSDVVTSPRARVLAVLPETTHPPIRYPLLRLTDKPATRAAEAFCAGRPRPPCSRVTAFDGRRDVYPQRGRDRRPVVELEGRVLGGGRQSLAGLRGRSSPRPPPFYRSWSDQRHRSSTAGSPAGGGRLWIVGAVGPPRAAGRALVRTIRRFPRLYLAGGGNRRGGNGLSLTVRAIRLSIEAIDPGLEAAARTLGASFWRVQLTIVLPLALPGVLTGVVLGFARCLGEFGATITFAANIPGQTQTLPLALFSLTEAPGNDMAAARLAVIGVALAMIALLTSEVMARRIGRRLGRQTRYSP